MTLVLADFISLSRIVIAYPMYKAMLAQNHIWTLLLLGWMVISDMLDGIAARHFGFSTLGKWIDPIADAFGVLAWVSALLSMEILSPPWVIFWALRYAFFAFWALSIRLRYGYYIAAGIWNKISIVCLVIFLFSAWWRGFIVIEFGFVLILTQLLSIWEALIAPPQHSLKG